MRLPFFDSSSKKQPTPKPAPRPDPSPSPRHSEPPLTQTGSRPRLHGQSRSARLEVTPVKPALEGSLFFEAQNTSSMELWQRKLQQSLSSVADL